MQTNPRRTPGDIHLRFVNLRFSALRKASGLSFRGFEFCLGQNNLSSVAPAVEFRLLGWIGDRDHDPFLMRERPLNRT